MVGLECIRRAGARATTTTIIILTEPRNPLATSSSKLARPEWADDFALEMIISGSILIYLIYRLKNPIEEPRREGERERERGEEIKGEPEAVPTTRNWKWRGIRRIFSSLAS